MSIKKEVIAILSDLLDISEKNISEETYIVRDLEAESVDFLELSVSISHQFKIRIKDEEIFLHRLRDWVEASLPSSSKDQVSFLLGHYPFLNETRILEILSDLQDGPVLKVKDLISYVSFHLTGQEAAKSYES